MTDPTDTAHPRMNDMDEALDRNIKQMLEAEAQGDEKKCERLMKTIDGLLAFSKWKS